MHNEYKNNHLFFGGYRITTILDKLEKSIGFDFSPFYLYSLDTMKKNYNTLNEIIKPHLICYSTKTNNHSQVLDYLFKEGCWIQHSF